MKPMFGITVALTVATATVGHGDDGRAATAPAPDFVHDVLPILQRFDCSSAYCHGSATGQAGFKLSLFGSDPAADFRAVARAFGGRRLDHKEPDQSLLLQKALGRLGHGGGRRFAVASQPHLLLHDWIRTGAPFAAGHAGRDVLTLRLEVRGAGLQATATTAAGERDVTSLALFSSTNPTVIEIDEHGALHERGPGQAHAVARFANHTATLPLLRPFDEPVAAVAEAAHPLDRAWRQHLANLRLAAADAVDAAALARRLYLDMVGRPPTPRELDAFTAAPDVAAVVRTLARGRDFAEVWGGHLARWFEVPAAGYAALIDAVARNESLVTVARRVVRGDLGTIRSLQDPRDRAEYVGRTLLGVRIGCARCHDHPHDRWRQREHLAFSACFASPRPDGQGGMTTGALFDEATGAAVTPTLPELGGAPLTGAASDRATVADFIVDPTHGRFASNASNRLFAALIGRGLVDPVDDHRPGNPPVSAAMLAALTSRFDATAGDLVELLVWIASSRPYRLGLGDAFDERSQLLAAQASRPLSPAAFQRAVIAVTGKQPRPVLPASPLAQQLALQNGPTLHRLLGSGGTTVDAIFTIGGAPRERLDELWRTLLSRSPRPEEIERFAPLADQDLAAFRDLAYALLASREFGHRR